MLDTTETLIALKLGFEIEDGTASKKMVPFSLETIKKRGFNLEIKYRAPHDFSEYLISAIKDRIDGKLRMTSYSEGKKRYSVFGAPSGQIKGVGYRIRVYGRILSVNVKDTWAPGLLNALYGN